MSGIGGSAVYRRHIDRDRRVSDGERPVRRITASNPMSSPSPLFHYNSRFDAQETVQRHVVDGLTHLLGCIRTHLGVFYHLIDPISALQRIAPLAKEVLVVETHIALRELSYPAMSFYPGAELNNDPTNWWGPNMACIRDLLRTIGFNRVQETLNGRGTFHAW